MDPLDATWTSSATALQVTADSSLAAEAGGTSMRLSSGAGAAGASAERTFAKPLDLSDFDELRFWIRASRPADGSVEQPFWLELSFDDTADTAADDHRWFVPVNRSGQWEHRRIGISGERRGAVATIRLTLLDAEPFECWVDELLAVSEEVVTDVEDALVARLSAAPALPGVTDVKLKSQAQVGDPQVELPLNDGFGRGNRVLLHGGTGADETHDVASVTNDPTTSTTTLTFVAGDLVGGQFNANAAGVTLLVPVGVESPPPPAPAGTGPTPTITVTYLEAREERGRGPDYLQRDSFRERSGRVVCSVRPAAQAWRIDYQVTSVGTVRQHQRAIQEFVLGRLAGHSTLRVCGYPSPVWEINPPIVMVRDSGEPAPLYLRVSTRREVSARAEQPWVRVAAVEAAQPDAPQDEERLEVTF